MSEGVTVLWIGRPLLVVYGPEVVKFFANERSVFDKPWMYQFFDYAEKDGIFRSSGKRGKQQRKLLAPPFFPRMMKNYVRVMNDHAVYLIRKLRQLENHTAEDTAKLIKLGSLKLFCEAAFGIKTSSDAEDSRISTFINSTEKVLEFVNYRLYRPWLHFNFMLHFSSAGRNHKMDVKKMNDVACQIIEEMKERYVLRNQPMESNEEDYNSDEQCSKSFGDFLFEQHLKDPSFTLRDLQTEIVTLIVAGYDTSSYCLMWTFWLLGFHHDIQEKAYKEVELVNSEFIDCDVASNLKYVECIIKESCRIYPVVPVFGRQSQKDLFFGNHKIPVGTTVIFCPYLLHRHPELYPDPEVFKPDRFLENESHFKPWTSMPFGESIRSCIGKNFAMLELKIMLAYVIRNFKIVSLTPKEDVEVSWEVMLKSSVPISLKFLPR